MSETLFRLLLRLYPRAFREEYGQPMRQLWRDRLRAETGPAARCRLWLDLLRDCAVSIPREYRRRPAQPALVGYHLSEAGVASLVRQGHFSQLPRMLLQLLCCAALAWFGGAPLLAVALVYGLLLAPLVLSLRGLAGFKHRWRGYEVTLDDARIQEFEHGVVKRTLLRDEVSALMETPGQGLAVASSDPRHAIWIPCAVNGYPDLRAQLSAWAPIQTDARRHSAFFGHYAVQSTLFLYPAALLARNPYVALPLAAVVAAGLIAFACLIYRQSRRASLMPIALLCILALRLQFL